jgi:hypothetical protein
VSHEPQKLLVSNQVRATARKQPLLAMNHARTLAYRLAVVGFGITAVLFTYLEMTDYTPFQPMMITVSLILCPASALSAGFLDIQPHSAEAILVWLVIAAVNGALYGVIGYAVGKYI